MTCIRVSYATINQDAAILGNSTAGTLAFGGCLAAILGIEASTTAKQWKYKLELEEYPSTIVYLPPPRRAASTSLCKLASSDRMLEALDDVKLVRSLILEGCVVPIPDRLFSTSVSSLITSDRDGLKLSILVLLEPRPLRGGGIGGVFVSPRLCRFVEVEEWRDIGGSGLS